MIRMNGDDKDKLIYDRNKSTHLADFLPIKSSTTFPPYSCCTHHHNSTTTRLGLNAHLGPAGERNRRECIGEQQPLMGGSSRWNPTSEQLLALEEMYRRGIRTPTAEQIQQIAGQLRWFGKIEGKNVFYWFQNHKARERQKRRREIETGLRRTVYEDEQKRTLLAPPSSCTEHLEVPVSINRKETAESITAHGWTQESRQQHKTCKLKWHAVDSCQSSSPILLKNMSKSTRFLNLQSQNSWFKSKRSLENNETNNLDDDHNRNGEVETLELFPLCSSEKCKKEINGMSKNDTEVSIKAINTASSPNQFFEFLPLKN